MNVITNGKDGALSTTEETPQKSAADQVKHDYDEWKSAAGSLLTSVVPTTVADCLAAAQVCATMAQAAAARLMSEPSAWMIEPTTGGPLGDLIDAPRPEGPEATEAAEAVGEARKLGYGRGFEQGFEQGVAEGLRQAAEAAGADNRRAQRAERDATRSGYLDAGDEIGGPWDDDEGPGFSRPRFGGAE